MAHPTTRAWDETDPATADQAKFGAQEIREHKQDVRERLEVDHEWNIGTSVDGFHKKVTLYTPLGAHPTMAANQGVVYTYDVSAKAELHWRDEDSNVIQITSAGEINPGAIRNASATQDGLVELSTDAEAQAKVDSTRALTPDNLAALDASETFSGLSERATNAEAAGRADDVRHLTAAKLGYVITGDTPATNFAKGHYIIYPNVSVTNSGPEPEITISSVATESTWESIGPTGSGATNETAVLDSIPTNCIGLLVYGITRVQQSSGSAFVAVNLSVADGNSSIPTLPPTTARYNLLPTQVYSQATNYVEIMGRQGFVEIDSSDIFFVYWQNAATSVSSMSLIIAGYVCQWPTS